MIYTIIAGVNGSGKSTLYKSNAFDDDLYLTNRINADEIIEKNYNNEWDNFSIQIRASKQAVSEIRKCIDEKISFNQETTLAGRSTIKNIKLAKKNGFRINLIYFALESVDISIDRVHNRVLIGGHGIPKDKLISRYDRSLANLKEVLPLCDDFIIFDNSGDFAKDVMAYKDGKVIILDKNIPEYLRPFLKDYI